MTQDQLSKVWTVLGLLLLYYALNTWIVSQGGNEVFDVKLIVSGRAQAALIGVVICSILLLLSSLAGWLFATRAGPHWPNRIPVVGLGRIDGASVEGRIFQVAMLVMLSLLPVLALGHFWHIVLSAPIVDRANDTVISPWDWGPTLRTLDDPARICTEFRSQQPNACVNSATFFPGLEPLLLAILNLAALIALVGHWLKVFRG